MVSVGKLRNRIELQKPIESPDGSGGKTSVWETFAEVWGSIQPLRGSRLIEAQGLKTEISQLITIRFRTDFLSGWRAKLGSRLFTSIYIVNPEEANVRLELYCKEHI